MNETNRKIDVLSAEIVKSMEVLNKIHTFYAENRSLLNDKKDRRNAIAISEIFLNYYTCLETIFLRISRFFENNLPNSKWHSELLGRMVLEVKPLRQKVISDKTFNILDEFRRFRHFKRYYFDFSYDWERLSFLKNKYEKLHPLVNKDLSLFLDFLEELKLKK